MKNSSKFLFILFFLLLIFLIAVQPVLAFDTEITPEELAEHAPRNHILAGVFMIIAFALKALVFIVPIPILYLASGLIFEPVPAFIINFVGMMVCTAMPYFIGRYSGAGLYQKLLKRYPKLQALDTFQHENQWFVSFMVRAVGFLPCDAVSLVLGVWKVSFLSYLSGTALGMLPGLIATTLIGITITQPSSPRFIISIILTVLVSVGSFMLWRLYNKARAPHMPQSALSAGLDPENEQDKDNHVDNKSNKNN